MVWELAACSDLEAKRGELPQWVTDSLRGCYDMDACVWGYACVCCLCYHLDLFAKQLILQGNY
jgi:hypothetical protein